METDDKKTSATATAGAATATAGATTATAGATATAGSTATAAGSSTSTTSSATPIDGRIFPLVWRNRVPSLGNCLIISAQAIGAEVEPLWQAPRVLGFPFLTGAQFTYVLARSQRGQPELTRALAQGLARRPRTVERTGLTPGFLLEIVDRRSETSKCATIGTTVCRMVGDGVLVLRAHMAGTCALAIGTATQLGTAPGSSLVTRQAIDSEWQDARDLQGIPAQKAQATLKSNEKSKAKVEAAKGHAVARHKRATAVAKLNDGAKGLSRGQISGPQSLQAALPGLLGKKRSAKGPVPFSKAGGKKGK